VKPVYSSETVAYKDFVSDDSGFFFDYNEGRRVFSVEATGDFSELVFSDSRPGQKVDPGEIRSTEELYHVVTFLSTLWSRPYIVAKIHEDRAVFLNRGLEYRAWWVRKRFDIIINSVSRWFKVKGKKSRHIVVTVTVPHSVPINEAYRLIRKRVREVIQFFRRRYGLRGYVGVLEVHKDGYPHYHLVLFTKRRLLLFNHKGIWRFVDKREWDRSLKVEKGFIDCMALRGGARGARAYFSKYLKKSYQNQEEEDKEINLKPYTLIVARLFKIRPLIYSRNFSLIHRRAKSKLKRELIEVGKLLSLKKTNLVEIATVQREIHKRLDYISRFCSHECVGSERIVLEFLRRGDLDKVFHYARYLYYSNGFTVVSLAWVSISVS